MPNTITLNPSEVEDKPKHAFIHELLGNVTYNVTVVACYICCRLLLVFDSSMNRVPNESDIRNTGWVQEQDSWCCPVCKDTGEDKE